MRRREDPTACEHPNEAPTVCPCAPGCYCHRRACDPRGGARRGRNGGNAGKGSRWVSKALRARIYERDLWRCVWCDRWVVSNAELTGCIEAETGRTIMLATLDHVVPRSKGGSDHPSNLVTCCDECNAERGARPALKWVRALSVRISGPMTAEMLFQLQGDIAKRVLGATGADLPPVRRAKAAA